MLSQHGHKLNRKVVFVADERVFGSIFDGKDLVGLLDPARDVMRHRRPRCRRVVLILKVPHQILGRRCDRLSAFFVGCSAATAAADHVGKLHGKTRSASHFCNAVVFQIGFQPSFFRLATLCILFLRLSRCTLAFARGILGARALLFFPEFLKSHHATFDAFQLRTLFLQRLQHAFRADPCVRADRQQSDFPFLRQASRPSAVVSRLSGCRLFDAQLACQTVGLATTVSHRTVCPLRLSVSPFCGLVARVFCSGRPETERCVLA